MLLQDVRLYDRALSKLEIEQIMRGTRAAYLAGKPPAKRSPAELTELFDWWLIGQDKKAQALTARWTKSQEDQAALRAKGSIAYVMQERSEEAKAFVLFRGEYDKRRDPVKPNTPAILPPLADLPHNRLGLAKWLLSADQPLTARVTVNRFWQEVFGTGELRQRPATSASAATCRVIPNCWTGSRSISASRVGTSRDSSSRSWCRPPIARLWFSPSSSVKRIRKIAIYRMTRGASAWMPR